MYNAHLEAVHEFLDHDNDLKKEKEGDFVNGHRYESEDGDAIPPEDDILCFTIGDEDPISHPSNTDPASRASIRVELAAMDAASSRHHHTVSRSRSSSLSSSSFSSSSSASTPPRSSPISRTRHPRKSKKRSSASENKEPRIQSHHIFSSLETTRPSISVDERTRLRSIYEDFTQSRDGEMRDGGGGTEVGGRVTLM